jgi:hypothetical protein
LLAALSISIGAYRNSFKWMPSRKKGACAPPSSLLLLTLGIRLVAILPRSLGMLLGVRRVLFALRVIAFAMMFGGGAMRFGRTLVKFSCLIVFIFGH